MLERQSRSANEPKPEYRRSAHDFSVSATLSAPSRALQFPATGQLLVEDWESSRWRGDVAIGKQNDHRGIKESYWSSKAEGNGVLAGGYPVQLLAQGMYRLEARARCEGVTPYTNDRNGGFRLRASGATPSPTLIGTRGWSALAIPFAVEVPAAQVELSCEFRAVQGTVWIDKSSLKLVKLR